jgi:hypothetical protein
MLKAKASAPTDAPAKFDQNLFIVKSSSVAKRSYVKSTNETRPVPPQSELTDRSRRDLFRRTPIPTSVADQAGPFGASIAKHHQVWIYARLCLNDHEPRPRISEELCDSRASEMNYPQTELQSKHRALVNLRALRILLRLRILGILGKVKRSAELSARFSQRATRWPTIGCTFSTPVKRKRLAFVSNMQLPSCCEMTSAHVTDKMREHLP